MNFHILIVNQNVWQRMCQEAQKHGQLLYKCTAVTFEGIGGVAVCWSQNDSTYET